MTLNEPPVSALVGYLEGRHAPGRTNVLEALTSSHHLLLAHGLAVPILRAESPGSQVGIALDYRPQTPASPSAADRAAAWHEGGIINRSFLDPIAGRGYPKDMQAVYGTEMSFVHPEDLERIAVALDFLGLNYYFRNIARPGSADEGRNLPRTIVPNRETTEMGWEVFPEGMYHMLGEVHFGYGFPAIFITENGAACADQLSASGEVIDPKRISYLRSHLQEVRRAIEAGVPVRGYFVWSLMDSFEWAFGTSKRFGLIFVDYPTQRRTINASGLWYRKIVEQNALD
jgi:beta-glucosidase